MIKISQTLREHLGNASDRNEMKTCYPYQHSPLLNFFVMTFPNSIPRRSQIFWARSVCEVPAKTLMLGILPCSMSGPELCTRVDLSINPFRGFVGAAVRVVCGVANECVNNKIIDSFISLFSA